MEKEWVTKISKVVPGKCFIRGYPHGEIIENLSYAEALFLTLKGRLATDKEESMLNAILNALTEHQFESGTVTTARHIVSGNPQIIPGMAGALLVIGKHTTQPQDAADLIDKDWDRMVTFYEFPKEHWRHLRTTNPIESPFAALRLRTDAARRYKKVENATNVIWKMLMIAETRFRRLRSPDLVRDVYLGKKYEDGERIHEDLRKDAA